MLGVLRQNWWLVALQGLAAVLFGIGALVWPGLTVVVLLTLFGAYALVNGIVTVISAIGGGAGGRRASLLVHGVFSIIIGILVLVWPGLTALTLLYFIAIWAIIVGILEIVAAVQLRQEIANEWLLGLAGALAIVFGIICFVHPAGGALALIWLIGIYAILFGVTLIALGFRLRALGDRLRTPSPRAA